MQPNFHFKKKLIIFLVLFVVLLYTFCVEPFWIKINIVTVNDEPFSSIFATYKTILISDIHVSQLGLRERLLLTKINEISPDIIFLTGDYVAWSGNYENAFTFLSKLKANIAIIGVLGDSDYQNSRKSCNFCHNFNKIRNDSSVRFLKDETVLLPVGQSLLAISGVEAFQKDLFECDKILKGNPGYPEIILSHIQPNLNVLSAKPVFVLSGDTHGGQIYMPEIIWRKIWSLSKGNIRAGLTEVGNKKLFVTSGIGTNSIPLRFLCPPEIVLFKGKE